MLIFFVILASVSMKQRWSVQNHIKTVHAIAVCNLIEMTMGLTAEASIPAHLRWLPMGMDVRYLKKASGGLTATCQIDPTSFFTLEKYPGEVKMPVEVKNSDGLLITDAVVCESLFYLFLFYLFTVSSAIPCFQVKLWISEKPAAALPR